MGRLPRQSRIRKRKMDKKVRSAERICIAAIIVLAVIALACIAILLTGREEQPTETEKTVQKETEGEKKLTEENDFLPSGVLYGERLPVTEFTDGTGEKKELSEYKGKMLVIAFWGSWCKYCEQFLEHSEEFRELLEERKDTNMVLIDKLDQDKGESREKVRALLSEKKVGLECLYDEGLKAYKAYGVKRIPTVIVLDDEGIVRYAASDVPESREALDSVLDYVKYGGSEAAEKFIASQLSGSEGGIYTNYTGKSGTHPTGHDVLSESQGLMMEYAVLADDQGAFDRAYDFLKANMYEQGIFSWYVTADGEKAGANALLDDLRICRALCMAEEQWGGYGKEVEELADAILKYNVYGDSMSSFYDFFQESPGSVISLCYGDLDALGRLQEQNNKWGELKDRMAAIVQDGYIGDGFPLYFSSYDYDKKKYSQDSINTAEALMTLYHLAEAGLLKETSEEWLLEQLEGDGLAARYNVDGTVVPGYDYETTAVYAIAGLIGYESGNAGIYTRSLQKIEQNRVWDTGSSFYGSFMNQEAGDDVIAFDQLMPLILYGYSKDVLFGS